VQSWLLQCQSIQQTGQQAMRVILRRQQVLLRAVVLHTPTTQAVGLFTAALAAMSDYFTAPAAVQKHLELLVLLAVRHLLPAADSIAGAGCTDQIWVLCRVRGSSTTSTALRLIALTIALSTARPAPRTFPTIGRRCFLIKNGETNPSTGHAPLDKEGRFSEQACLPEKRGDLWLVII
jgi:hypothetical protein